MKVLYLYGFYRANSRINGCLYVPWSDNDLLELRKVSKLGSKFEGKWRVTGGFQAYKIIEL